MMLNNVIVWDIETVPDLKGFGGQNEGHAWRPGGMMALVQPSGSPRGERAAD